MASARHHGYLIHRRDRRVTDEVGRACPEGLFCGTAPTYGSSAVGPQARPDKTVVTLAPDTGERYFSTVLFEGE
ncbi:MAG: hypothetical protein ACLVHL_05285 [Collinsella intestinalis]